MLSTIRSLPAYQNLLAEFHDRVRIPGLGFPFARCLYLLPCLLTEPTVLYLTDRSDRLRSIG